MLKCIDINKLVSKVNVREEKDETIKELADSIRIKWTSLTSEILERKWYEIINIKAIYLLLF